LSESSQGLALTQNVDRGFLLSTTFPKILTSSGSKKATQICYPFPSKGPGKWIPSRFPYREKYPLPGHFYLPLNVSLFIFPSEFPVKEPLPCSLTGSRWAAILPSPEPLVYFSFIHSFIHVCQSPQKGALLHMYGEKHMWSVQKVSDLNFSRINKSSTVSVHHCICGGAFMHMREFFPACRKCQ